VDADLELEAESVRRVRMVVAYRGTDFHGFAPNPGVRTVLGELTTAVSRVVRLAVELTGAGRTDAGVHAWGQVVSGDLPIDADLSGVARRVNKLCAPSIAVRSIEWAAPGFDARFSATWRRYRYHVWNDPSPNPLLADVSWHVATPLDVAAMQAALPALLGEHDFSSFCRRAKVAAGTPEPSTVRILHDAAWEPVGDTPLLRFEVRASAFCHQMVRSIVGTTVDVGLGRLAADRMAAILDRHDRAAAGRVAPPTGLILWDVGYDGRRWDAPQ
jgi:tRNA pseudouridine38-40 synthase